MFSRLLVDGRCSGPKDHLTPLVVRFLSHFERTFVVCQRVLPLPFEKRLIGNTNRYLKVLKGSVAATTSTNEHAIRPTSPITAETRFNFSGDRHSLSLKSLLIFFLETVQHQFQDRQEGLGVLAEFALQDGRGNLVRLGGLSECVL